MIKVSWRLFLQITFIMKIKNYFLRRCIMRKKYKEPMIQFFVLSCTDVLTMSTQNFTEQDINLDEVFQIGYQS